MGLMKQKYDEFVNLVEELADCQNTLEEEVYYLSLCLGDDNKAKSQLEYVEEIIKKETELESRLAQFQKDMALTDDEVKVMVSEILYNEEKEHDDELRRLPK